MRDYLKVLKAFEDRGCQLLETKESVEANTDRHPKFRYIAQCGHENIVFYNVFCGSRATGHICNACTCKRNGERSKENKQDDKLCNVKLELKCMEFFQQNVASEFVCIKAFDGCKADLIMKPKEVDIDEWMGIQVKSVASVGPSYGFHIENDYNDMLMLCMCWENKKTWLIPYSVVQGQRKLTIGLTKSKYSKYEILDNNQLSSTLQDFYESVPKIHFEALDTPGNKWQKREKTYREFRAESIPFLTFVNNAMEGLVYDFTLNGKKVQEKVGGYNKDKKAYNFHLLKNGGKIENKKFNRVCYDIGDCDIYWLNCADMRQFYVFPEQVLIEQGWISRENKRIKIINLKPNGKNRWYNDYLFDYTKIDKERLLKVLNMEENVDG